MLNINNLQKKTLKITIPIFLMMVFSFIFIPGVSASQPISIVGTNIYNLEDCTYFTYTEEQIDNLITTAKAKLTEKGVNADDFNKFNLVVHRWTYGNEINFYLYNDYDIDNNRITFDFTGTPSVPLTVFYQNTNGYIKYSKRNAVDPDKLVYSSFTSSKTNVNTSFQYFENNDGSGVYILTNFDLINKSNEVIISQNFNVEPQSYTFSEDIVATNLSKIKVKFDLPSDTKNLFIDFSYNIKQLSFGVGDFGEPYRVFKSLDENNNEITSISSFSNFRNKDHIKDTIISLIENYYDDNNSPVSHDSTIKALFDDLDLVDKYSNNVDIYIENAINKNLYIDDDNRYLFNNILPLAKRYVFEDYCSGSYSLTLLPDSTIYYYSFEVDVYNYDGTINLSFISNLNYTIEYEYKSDLEDYLTTINMDNYSALILIPKVKNLESGSLSSISSDVYLSGIYDINLLEDIDSKNVLYHHSDYDYSVFSHYQDYHYLNAILLFVKKSFGSVNNTITFDSRYYSYVTKFNLSDEVTINNPNTGEDIAIGDISDFYDYGLDNKKFTFNSFLKPIKFVFESITNFYQNYCPELVQNFFYLIFVFFVVLVLIRVFL